MSVEEEVRGMGIEGIRVVEVNGDERVRDILRLCDPRREMLTETDFVKFWTEVRSAVASFLHPYITHPPMQP